MARAERISISDKLAAIQKKQGVRIGTATQAIEPVYGLSTGNVVIDHLTGVGGLPKGRISEIFGLESSGKSTIALQAAAVEQQRLIRANEEGYILYLDHEKALNYKYMKALGIDTEHESFVTAQPTYMEQGGEIAVELLKDLPVKMIIWDSVGVMVPKARAEGEFDQRTAAMNRARMLTGLLQMIVGPLHDTQCAGVFINHLYTTIPTGYGQVAKDTTPGGKGLDYYSSLRLKTTTADKKSATIYDVISNENIETAQFVNTIITVAKNKVAPNAYRKATVRLELGRGFDNFWSVINILKDNKRVSTGGKGAHYFDPRGQENLAHPAMKQSPTGRPTIYGEHNVVKFARDHPEWAETLTKIAVDLLSRNPDSYAIDDSDEESDLDD